jgi:hypothetical protein
VSNSNAGLHTTRLAQEPPGYGFRSGRFARFHVTELVLGSAAGWDGVRLRLETLWLQGILSRGGGPNIVPFGLAYLLLSANLTS